MHILQLTDFYHPIIGGLERHVATFSQELTKLGHSITVVTLQPGGLPDEESIDGIRVIRICGWSQQLTMLYSDAGRPFHPTSPDPGVISAVRRIIQRERPDVVHSHSWIQYSFFPLYRADRGPAHVVTLHDYGLTCARKSLQQSKGGEHCPGPTVSRCLACAPEQYGLLRGAAITASLRINRFMHQRADHYIAISNAVAEESRKALPSQCGISVIPSFVPNGMDVLAHQTPRPDFLPATDGYLMFVGALGRHKGLDVLLEARRRMRNDVPLLIIGTPRTDTPQLEGSGITVERNVPNAEVMAAWARASVAVVPSVWHEPMGQVAVEAMLAGRPVVASNVGGLRDIVDHEVTGLLIPPSDPGALAAALDRLIESPEWGQRLGARGRLHARQFEVSAVAPRIVEVFAEALARRDALDCGTTS